MATAAAVGTVGTTGTAEAQAEAGVTTRAAEVDAVEVAGKTAEGEATAMAVAKEEEATNQGRKRSALEAIMSAASCLSNADMDRLCHELASLQKRRRL